MATRGVYGFQHKGEMKAFFDTGADIFYWLQNAFDVVNSLDANKNPQKLVELFESINIDDNYQKATDEEILRDFYFAERGSRRDNETIMHLDSSYFVNTIKKDGLKIFNEEKFINDAVLGLDSLMIELAVIINIDTLSVDIYKGSVYLDNGSLKEAKDKSEFLALLSDAQSFENNYFVKQYIPLFETFKKRNEIIKSEDFKEKCRSGEVQHGTKEHKDVYFGSIMFDSGPLMKVASLDIDFLNKFDIPHKELLEDPEIKEMVEHSNLLKISDGIQYHIRKKDKRDYQYMIDEMEEDGVNIKEEVDDKIKMVIDRGIVI